VGPGVSHPPAPRPSEADLWERIGQLHAHHGEVSPEGRLLKLAEETGEAAAAYIGMTGMNSRKGMCASRDDMLDELADVIITAAVAMACIARDSAAARRHFEQRLATVLGRAGITAQETPGRRADERGAHGC
jgi:NTP pyrophosphatase (non-canonical NTP hydrolase)